MRLSGSVVSATLLGLGLLGLQSGLAMAASPTGTFLTEDGRARVRTELCGPAKAELCGYVVWLKKPLDDNGKPRLDAENPDSHKKTRLLLGHQMIEDLKLNDDGRYEGKIYNAENGKSYDVTIWSEEADALNVKGCLLAMLCKSQSWARVTDVAPGQLTGATNGPGGPRMDAAGSGKAK